MECLIKGDHSEWLAKGLTVLLIKDSKQGTTSKNYGPIMCLLATLKLLSGIVADKLEEHTSHPPTSAQWGNGRNTRVAKCQLLVDQAIFQDTKKRQTNLAMAWIDYKKAYDSIPNSWILQCLSM